MNEILPHRHSESGFSLVEMVVVLAIIGILMTIGTINFSQWLTKNRIESQVRQMTSDFSQVRIKAFTKKQRHSIYVDRTSYVFKSYSSDSEDLASQGTVLSGGAHTVTFPLKSDSSTYYSGRTFEIDSRGILVGLPGTVYLEYGNATPALDCMTLHTVRINPGKRNAAWSDCDDK